MDILFINMLNMSITAGWLIIAVIIVRALFKSMPKRIRCILWGFVAVRLICPFAFTSNLSLIPDTRVIRLDNDLSNYRDAGYASENYYNASNVLNTFIGTALMDDYYSAQGGVVSSLNADKHKVSSSIKYAVTKLVVSHINTDIISARNVLFSIEILWILCICVLVFYAILNYIKLKQCIYESVHYENDASGRVMLADAVKMPFIFGIFNPKIYVPSDTDEKEMKYIIAHETAHIKRRDYLWKLLGYVLLTAYCFNPLVWLAYFLFCRDLELACDENVICKYDSSEKKLYSETLLACSMQKRSVLSCPLAFGEIAVKERIKAVMNHKKTKISIIIASIVVCAVLAVCFLTNPITSSAMTVASDDGKMVQITYAGEGVETVEQDAIQCAEADVSGEYAILSDDLNDVFSKEQRDEYAKFGLTYDEKGGKMMYKGKPVKFFYDGTGDGKAEDWFRGSTVLYTYVDEAGEVYIHTVRDAGHFKDSGHFELGELLGIEEYSKEDIKKLDIGTVSEISGPVYTYAVETSEEEVNIMQFDSQGECVSLTTNPVSAVEGETIVTVDSASILDGATRIVIIKDQEKEPVEAWVK